MDFGYDDIPADILDSLTLTERMILEYRFGINENLADYPPHTLQETSERFANATLVASTFITAEAIANVGSKVTPRTIRILESRVMQSARHPSRYNDGLVTRHVNLGTYRDALVSERRELFSRLDGSDNDREIVAAIHRLDATIAGLDNG